MNGGTSGSAAHATLMSAACKMRAEIRCWPGCLRRGAWLPVLRNAPIGACLRFSRLGVGALLFPLAFSYRSGVGRAHTRGMPAVGDYYRIKEVDAEMTGLGASDGAAKSPDEPQSRGWAGLDWSPWHD